MTNNKTIREIDELTQRAYWQMNLAALTKFKKSKDQYYKQAKEYLDQAAKLRIKLKKEDGKCLKS